MDIVFVREARLWKRGANRWRRERTETVKKGQIEGLRDPNGSLIEELQIDPNHVKRLAQSYLDKTAKRSA